MKLVLVVIVGLLLPASLAQAWNLGGHMTTGAIAYNRLMETDPAAVDQILEILKSHPDYDEWEHIIHDIPEPYQDRVIFMMAARWPDDVRGEDEDRGTWHYINHPYSPDGIPTPNGPPGGQEDLYFAYRLNLQIIEANGSDSAKAVALCWLFHLMGDSHMPLHVAELFSNTFPEGENGATRCYIKATAGADSISLHQFWDGLVQGSSRTRNVAIKARVISNAYPAASLSELESVFNETDFARKWCEVESLTLAKDAAYRHSGTLLDLSPSKNTAKPLPSGYAAAVEPIAHKRAALSGYRLALLLSSQF